MAEGVKLYAVWGSPFSRRVEIALKLKGILYEYIEEDLKNKSPDLLKYNPVNKKIPILVHNGKPIVESQIIVEYIDESWPGYATMPQDPYDHAMARFWAKLIDGKCLPSVWKAFWGTEEEQKNAADELQQNLSFLEKELEVNGKKFFGGDKVGFVDIIASFFALWLESIQEASGKELLAKEWYPCLFEWAHDFTSCSVIRESLPPKERLVAFYEARIEAANLSK